MSSQSVPRHSHPHVWTQAVPSQTMPTSARQRSSPRASWAAQPAAAWSAVSGPGAMTSLTAALDGTLVLATTSGLYVLPANSSQWKPASAAGASSPPGGFTYVGMTTNDQGVALPADTSLHEIWMTFDGGQTWAARTPITPGN